MNLPPPESTIQTLETIAAILLRCFLITLIALLFVWSVVLLMDDILYRIHAGLFDLTRKEYDLFILYSLTFIKSLNVVLFLFPFVAIRLFLRSRKRSG